MWAVATPISGSSRRQSCVQFRPRTSADRDYLRLTYGDGCSGTVRETIKDHFSSNDSFQFRLVTHREWIKL
jgi:hypothetical protein